MRIFSTILRKYVSIVHEQQNKDRQFRFIDPIWSSNRIISSTDRQPDHTSKAFHVQAELYSQTDTTAAGCNYTV